MEENKLFEIFISESEEIIQDLESDLIQLENSPEDEELINKIFRAVHTMKSSSGIVGLDRLSKFIHILENIFDRVREKELPVTKKLISVFLEANDFLKNTISKLTQGDTSVEEKAVKSLEKKFERFSGTLETEESKDKEVISAKDDKEHYYRISMKFRPNLFETGQDPILLFLELEDLGQIIEVEAFISDIPDFSNFQMYNFYVSWKLIIKTNQPQSRIQNVFVFVEADNEIKIEDVSSRFRGNIDKKQAGKLIGEILVDEGAVTESEVDEALDEQRKTGEILIEKNKITADQLEKALDSQKQSRDTRIANTIRVDTNRLDKLVDLVGEMVIGVAHVN